MTFLDCCRYIKENRPNNYKIKFNEASIYIENHETQKGIVAKFSNDAGGFSLFKQTLKSIAGLFPLTVKQFEEYCPKDHFSGLKPADRSRLQIKDYFGSGINGEHGEIIQKLYEKVTDYIRANKPCVILLKNKGNNINIVDEMNDINIASYFLPCFKSKLGVHLYEIFKVDAKDFSRFSLEKKREPLLNDNATARQILLNKIKKGTLEI